MPKEKMVLEDIQNLRKSSKLKHDKVSHLEINLPLAKRINKILKRKSKDTTSLTMDGEKHKKLCTEEVRKNMEYVPITEDCAIKLDTDPSSSLKAEHGTSAIEICTPAEPLKEEFNVTDFTHIEPSGLVPLVAADRETIDIASIELNKGFEAYDMASYSRKTGRNKRRCSMFLPPPMQSHPDGSSEPDELNEAILLDISSTIKEPLQPALSIQPKENECLVTTQSSSCSEVPPCHRRAFDDTLVQSNIPEMAPPEENIEMTKLESVNIEPGEKVKLLDVPQDAAVLEFLNMTSTPATGLLQETPTTALSSKRQRPGKNGKKKAWKHEELKAIKTPESATAATSESARVKDFTRAAVKQASKDRKEGAKPDFVTSGNEQAKLLDKHCDEDVLEFLSLGEKPVEVPVPEKPSTTTSNTTTSSTKQQRGKRKSADYMVITETTTLSPGDPPDVIQAQLPMTRRTRSQRRMSLELFKAVRHREEELSQDSWDSTDSQQPPNSEQRAGSPTRDAIIEEPHKYELIQTEKQGGAPVIEPHFTIPVSVSKESTTCDTEKRDICESSLNDLVEIATGAVEKLCDNGAVVTEDNMNIEEGKFGISVADANFPVPPVQQVSDPLGTPVQESEPSPSTSMDESPRRSRRAKSSGNTPTSITKRKPLKRKPEAKVEDIYLNKLWREQLPKEKAWETILEQPKHKKTGEECVFTAQRKKCLIKFDEFYHINDSVRLQQRRKKALKMGWKPKKKTKAGEDEVDRKLRGLIEQWEYEQDFEHCVWTPGDTQNTEVLSQSSDVSTISNSIPSTSKLQRKANIASTSMMPDLADEAEEDDLFFTPAKSLDLQKNTANIRSSLSISSSVSSSSPSRDSLGMSPSF